jgi:hypothetical protein
MRLLLNSLKGALLGAVLLLSACATQDYASRMYEPNFGLRMFPHFDSSLDPDPKAIANGLYTSQPLQDPCYLCSSQSPLTWSSWTP